MIVLSTTQAVASALVGGSAPAPLPGSQTYVVETAGRFFPNVSPAPGQVAYATFQWWWVTAASNPFNGLTGVTVDGYGYGQVPLDLAAAGPTVTIPVVNGSTG
jgi:hypothetical protein